MGRVLHVIGLLTVLTDIQAFLLFILRHTQTQYHIDDLENDPGGDRCKQPATASTIVI